MSHIGAIDCQREGKMNAMWRNKQNLRLSPLANPGPQAYAYADHREHQEGLMAFLEKRPSAF